MNHTPQQLLHSLFGYEDFRGQQLDVIQHVIDGGDALVLMPTGGGKSICYQIPAMLRDGVGVVISPLIALMQDQVSSMQQLGVNAQALHSGIDWQLQNQIQQQALNGDLDLLYISPERLMTEACMNLLRSCKIALFAIDEAHCVSHWGHDFRLDYLQLQCLQQNFPHLPRMLLLRLQTGLPTKKCLSV